jgi:hypothetical protein
MTVRRLIHVAALSVLVAGSLASTACGSKKINDLLADPGRYRNETVQLSGEVVDSYSVANRGAYRIDDGTGQLWIVSDNGVPRKTARVTVKGTVREGFNLGSLAEMLRLPPGIAAGMVLMESSHKAKR